MRSTDWDERYAEKQQWSAGPNALIAELLADVPPDHPRHRDLLEIRDADWHRFFEVNVMSGVRLSRAYLPGMLEIVEDTGGQHDFLLTPCSQATFRHFYPDKPVHRGCFGNLARPTHGLFLDLGSRSRFGVDSHEPHRRRSRMVAIS